MVSSSFANPNKNNGQAIGMGEIWTNFYAFFRVAREKEISKFFPQLFESQKNRQPMVKPMVVVGT